MKALKWLVAVLLILAVLLGGWMAWFFTGHIRVGSSYYAKNAEFLDARGLDAAEYEALKAAFPNSDILWELPLEGNFYPLNAKSVTVSNLTAADVEALDYLPGLEEVDARECRDYDQLLALHTRRPELKLNYYVEAAGTRCSSQDRQLQFTGISAEELDNALTLLPSAETVRLEGNLPSADELAALAEKFPAATFLWEAIVEGKTYPNTTEALELTQPLADPDGLSDALAMLPGLKTVDLRGSGLSDADCRSLADRYPDCFFLWNLNFLGTTFCTDAEEIDISGTKLADTDEVEALVGYFHNLNKVIMSDCGIPSEDMDALNRRHEDIKFVWTVKLGPLNVRTDETYFIPVKYRKTVETKDLAELKYCTDMVSIDIGHMWVKDCEWAAYMPNLEYLIIGETQISDLSPLSGLKKLRFLELFTIPCTDYTPLLGCTGMEYLNLGLTYGDPDVIAQMTWLKYLWWCDANGYKKPERREAVERMCAALSDTQIKIYINHPTASGWRLLPGYFEMRDSMDMFYLPDD